MFTCKHLGKGSVADKLLNKVLSVGENLPPTAKSQGA